MLLQWKNFEQLNPSSFFHSHSVHSTDKNPYEIWSKKKMHVFFWGTELKCHWTGWENPLANLEAITGIPHFAFSDFCSFWGHNEKKILILGILSSVMSPSWWQMAKHFVSIVKPNWRTKSTSLPAYMSKASRAKTRCPFIAGKPGFCRIRLKIQQKLEQRM